MGQVFLGIQYDLKSFKENFVPTTMGDDDINNQFHGYATLNLNDIIRCGNLQHISYKSFFDALKQIW